MVSLAYTRPHPHIAQVLVINLERRPDRIAALKKLKLPFDWVRLDAVDGRTLSWSTLLDGTSTFGGLVHPDAIKEAIYAERQSLPTICRRTGSFSPHLTLGAVGIARTGGGPMGRGPMVGPQGAPRRSEE